MSALPRRSLLWVLAALCLAPGCRTVEVIHYPETLDLRHVQQEQDFEETPEGKLIAATEANPQDAKAWWRLGDFYERRRRYPQALKAFREMQAAIDEVERKSGREYVGGLYLLGKTHALLQDWQPAVAYLRRVLEKQPDALGLAYANPYFREAHYLLGAIYFEHRMWEAAERHLVTFSELATGQDIHRAEGMLMQIDRELRPESRHGFAGSDDLPHSPVARLGGSEGTLIVEDPEGQ